MSGHLPLSGGRSVWTSDVEAAEARRARAELLAEWLRHKADAERFGSKDPAAVADVLTFGTTGEAK